MGEQMQQIREEICSWVALGKLLGVLAEQGTKRMAGHRRGKCLFFIFDFAGPSDQEPLLFAGLWQTSAELQTEGRGGH